VVFWLGGFATPPREVFLTHGEPEASELLRKRIAHELGWECRIPEHRERFAEG
jgi:metallo-beta-lactamase family protein